MNKNLSEKIAELSTERQNKIELRTQALIALERTRQLRKAKKALGVDAIYLFVSDVDGDWLENWT